ncbi:MAG: hypothetical protein ACREIV_01060 [Planctomycetaceae bacterium]
MFTRFSKTLRMLFLPVAAIALGLSADRPAEAKSLDDAARSLAGQIVRYMQSKNEDSVVIGDFDGPAISSAGPEFKKSLRDALEALDVQIKQAGGMQVRGDFKLVTDESRSQTTVVLNTAIFDRSGAVAYNFSDKFGAQTINDPQDVAVIAGANVDAVTPSPAASSPAASSPAASGPAPNGAASIVQAVVDAAERDKAITESIVNPAVFLGEQGVISAKPESPYRSQVLVRTGESLTPCAVEVDGGFAFANLDVNDIYAVQLINDSDLDAAVSLTIDGLNVFEFSSNLAYKGHGCFIIPKQSAGVVRGWHLSDDPRTGTDSFLITELPQSEAAKLGRDKTSIGTITASFFVAWSAGEDQPAVELLGSRSVGTTRGPKAETNYQPTERFIGRSLLAAVSCRYVKPEIVAAP